MWMTWHHINGIVQDRSNSSALTNELLQGISWLITGGQYKTDK